MNILETLIRLRDDIKTWVTNNLVALDEKIESKTIPVDNALNKNSTNPVQNKAITEEIDRISDSISNITDDGSDNFSIADSNGNVIFKADAEGMHTTNVDTQSISADGDNFSIADINGNTIFKVDANGTHTTDVTINGVSVKTKMAELEAKPSFSGDYNDLTNAPAIVDDGSGEVVYTDNDGNIIVKINADGLATTNVIANDVILNGVNASQVLETTVDRLGSLEDDCGAHMTNGDVHIAEHDRAIWNAKSDFSGSYNDLTDKPTYNKADVGLGNVDNTSDADKPVSDAQQAALDSLRDELSENIVSESNEWTVVDSDGNIIGKLDSEGFTTTSVNAQTLVVNGVDYEVIDTLDSDDTTKPLSAAQGKALKTAINSITTDLGDLGGGDMLRATYDPDGDGIVDNASRLEGHAASYFATANHGTHLTLGTGASNAYYGDKGKTAYDHSQATHAPSNAQKNSDITKAEIEAKLTGDITSHTHDYAANGHDHNNLGTTATTGDILEWALNSSPAGTLSIQTNANTTNLPTFGSYAYSSGYVLRRVTDQVTIVLYDYRNGTPAINTYLSGTWNGWKRIADTTYVGDYVRDAIAEISTSTAAGGVREFDSEEINYTMDSGGYSNSKDSKSNWYWIWVYNSKLGGYMGIHVDFKALTTGGQPIICGSSSTEHFAISVSKNSSGKLVASSMNNYTTIKRVVGYY